MLSIYPACFFKEENHYSVIFPDFNYLSTCGDSLQDAMENGNGRRLSSRCIVQRKTRQ